MKLRLSATLAISFIALANTACGPKPEEYRALGTHAQQAFERARVNQTVFFAAVTAAVAQPADVTGCTPSMVERGHEHIDNYATARLETLSSAETSRFAALQSWVRTHDLYFDGHIKLKAEDLARMAREVDEIDHSRPYEILMVRTAWIAPRMSAGGYSPGQYTGRLFVWDSHASRIVCSASVNVSAPPSVRTYGGDPQSQIAGALVHAAEEQAWQAAALGERGVLGAYVSNSH